MYSILREIRNQISLDRRKTTYFFIRKFDFVQINHCMMCQKGIFRRKKCQSCVQPYPNFPCKICKRGLFQESSSQKPPPSSHYNISSDLHFFPVTTFPTELLTMIDLHSLGRCWSVGQKNQDTFCTVQVRRMLKIPHQNQRTKRFFPGRLTTQKNLQQKKEGFYKQKSSLLSLKQEI